MLLLIDDIIYPVSLGLTILFTLVLISVKKKIITINFTFEKVFGYYALIHTFLTVFVLYLIFGNGPGMFETDLSPFVFLLAVIPLVSHKALWLRKALMPFMLMSGFIAMCLSDPGFSANFVQDSKFLFIFIEAFFTYIKHILILIIGIYFFLTNNKLQKWEWTLNLFVPISLVSWILISSGVYFWITDNSAYGRISTGILLPSTIPWGTYEHWKIGEFGQVQGLNNDQYLRIIASHPDWKNLFVKHNNQWYAKFLETKSLWGIKYYSGESSYKIIQKLVGKWKLPYYWITTLLYVLAFSSSFIITWSSHLTGKKLWKNR